ncbi:hypothetical protein CVR97_28235, partial [Salmonella enterica subsp. enterica serovar Typhimurium]|uniref:DUF3310 domain-containing protein n=1 Tax=Salmonella enterica TaxID=28901 RepID=UPI000C21EAE8
MELAERARKARINLVNTKHWNIEDIMRETRTTKGLILAIEKGNVHKKRKKKAEAYLDQLCVDYTATELNELCRGLKKEEYTPQELDATKIVCEPLNAEISAQQLNEDPIEPSHYNRGNIDLYESWYQRLPFNEFKAIMRAIAERYMWRDKNDTLEDLNKAT